MANFLTTNLQPGQSGEEVKQLQEWLIQQGYSIPAGATGFYGEQTKLAVNRLQQDLGVDVAGNPGFWGPRTQAKINELNNPPRTEVSGYIAQSGQTSADIASSSGLRLSQLLDLNPQLKRREPQVGEQIIIPPKEVINYANSKGISITQAVRDMPQPQIIQPEAITQSKTGNPVTDEMLNSIQELLDGLNKRGQIVNPYVELTPEKQLEFLTMARGEVSPYYETQLKLAKDSLYKDLKYSTEQVLANEANLERQYGKELRTLTGQMEDTGMLYSGQRLKSEQDLADQAQRDIASGRQTLQYGAGKTARDFASLWGGNALTTPQIQQAPRVLPGTASFETPTSTEGLYTLSPDIYDSLMGSNQKEQELGARSLASGYETSFAQGELAKRQMGLEGITPNPGSRYITF